MILNDIYERLRKLDIPVAYNVIRENTLAPYIVFYETGGENYGADYHNLIRKRNVKVELYCKEKNLSLEKNLENLFMDYELDVSETWLESSDLIRISYSFQTFEKIKI